MTFCSLNGTIIIVNKTDNQEIDLQVYKNVEIDGKKGKAETILYEAFDIIKEKTNEDPVVVFEKALENKVSGMEQGIDDIKTMLTKVLTNK